MKSKPGALPCYALVINKWIDTFKMSHSDVNCLSSSFTQFIFVSSPRHNVNQRLVEITLSCFFRTVSKTSNLECGNFTMQFHEHHDTSIAIRVLKFICGNARARVVTHVIPMHYMYHRIKIHKMNRLHL